MPSSDRYRLVPTGTRYQSVPLGVKGGTTGTHRYPLSPYGDRCGTSRAVTPADRYRSTNDDWYRGIGYQSSGHRCRQPLTAPNTRPTQFRTKETR